MSLASYMPVKPKYGAFKQDSMMELYMREFDHLRETPVKMLELGIFMGGSLTFWKKFFPHGTIAGVDRKVPPRLANHPEIRCFAGDQQDIGLLDRVASEVAPEGFDIIIDDCSHIGELAKISLWHLFENYLKPGGIYVIEDWMTGYSPDWPDGRTLNYDPRDVPPSDGVFHGHQSGLAGFIKELIDEFARNAFFIPLPDPSRRPRFAQMKVTECQVFIYKPPLHQPPSNTPE